MITPRIVSLGSLWTHSRKYTLCSRFHYVRARASPVFVTTVRYKTYNEIHYKNGFVSL